jgi:hypothetical protein
MGYENWLMEAELGMIEEEQPGETALEEEPGPSEEEAGA